MNTTSGVREFQISNWRPRESKALRGFFSITTPNNMVIHDCQLFEKGDRRWVGLPTKQYESGGERKFAPIVTFTDRHTEDRFCHQALIALDRHLAEANHDQD